MAPRGVAARRAAGCAGRGAEALGAGRAGTGGAPARSGQRGAGQGGGRDRSRRARRGAVPLARAGRMGHGGPYALLRRLPGAGARSFARERRAELAERLPLRPARRPQARWPRTGLRIWSTSGGRILDPTVRFWNSLVAELLRADPDRARGARRSPAQRCCCWSRRSARSTARPCLSGAVARGARHGRGAERDQPRRRGARRPPGCCGGRGWMWSIFGNADAAVDSTRSSCAVAIRPRGAMCSQAIGTGRIVVRAGHAAASGRERDPGTGFRAEGRGLHPVGTLACRPSRQTPITTSITLVPVSPGRSRAPAASSAR